MISDAVKGAIADAFTELEVEVNGYKKEVIDLKDHIRIVEDERKVLNKVISDQQRFLETVKKDKVKLKDKFLYQGSPTPCKSGVQQWMITMQSLTSFSPAGFKYIS